MKKLVIKDVEGLLLFMPEFVADHWPVLPLDEFPGFCGAGEGWGDKAVPETMWGLSQRHCCFIHDCMFTLLSPEKNNWHIANRVMMDNLLETIQKRSNCIMVHPRRIRALTYYGFVETGLGWKNFVNRKIVQNYNPYEDRVLIEKFRKVGVTLNSSMPQIATAS